MATFMARSAALAGAIVAGVVCAAPARAACTGICEYAFGDTASDVADLVLTLSNGTSITLPATIQGYVTSFGAPSSSKSYLAGVYSSASYVDYFQFTLPSESAGVTVSSATLTLYSGVISSELKYTLLGPTAAVISSTGPNSPSEQLYQALQNGTTYATYTLSPNSLSQIMISLNGAAISKLDKALEGNKQFLIAGNATPVPEPSTWIMMLAGFAGLGFLARHRAARRRAAAATG